MSPLLDFSTDDSFAQLTVDRRGGSGSITMHRYASKQAGSTPEAASTRRWDLTPYLRPTGGDALNAVAPGEEIERIDAPTGVAHAKSDDLRVGEDAGVRKKQLSGKYSRHSGARRRGEVS